MRTTLLLLVLLAGPALASQTVWKWVDEDGVTHFSDRAVPGATKVELSTGSSSSSADSSPPPADDSAQARAAERYTDFQIWQPSDEESIVNTGGSVTVSVRLEPALRAGHSVFVYLDGKLVDGYPGNTLSFDLKEVPRGTHTVIAVINDSRGQRVQETEAVRFTVRQESIAQPPVGPSLRPSPKPTPRPNASSKDVPTSQPTYSALNGSRPVMDPATNQPAKPAVSKPTTPGPRQGN